MLSQSDETIAAWKATERTLAVRVTIAGKEYTATDINSLKYDAGAYTGETFAIGSTYSNNIQIEFSHLVEGLKLGDIVEVSIGIKVSNKYIYDPLGVFVISSEIKMDRNNNLTTISASDAFCKLEGVYKSKLIYPAKVLDVISEICAMAGAEPNTSELSRLPKLADIPTAIEGQSYRKALGWIAQLYAGYATFDRSGKLTIRTVAEPSYELDPSQYEQSGLTKNEATYKISGIQCQVTTKTTTRDDQAQETTTTLQSGSASGAQIKLENNIMTQARLDDVWQKLKDINFYPFSLNWFGNPAIEAGDWLRLYDKKGNDFVVPNNGYTLEFNGGLSAVSKADQTSGSSQVVSWTGGLMQTIRELQHRNVPDGTVIFPTSVTEPPKNAHFNDVWFKKNGNSTELWIFERQSDGTGEWQRNDIVNDEIKEEIKRQQAELDELSKNVDDSIGSFQQSLSGIYDAVENAKINTDKAVQQALDQAQKASNDLLNYASGFDSEINLLNEAKDKNKADINKLLTDVNGVKGMYADLEGNISNFNAGLNGLSAQLKDAKNQLASVKLTADGAVSNFANLQGDIASLSTKANKLEQQMLTKVESSLFESFRSSTAQALNSKLTASDLNGYARSSEVEQTANGLRASIISVDGKIDNLSVGGRNYLQGSLNFKWPEGVGRENVTPSFETQGDATVAHLSSQSNGGIYTKWRKAFPNGELQVGDDYTLSFDAKGLGMFIAVGNESGNQAVNSPISNTSLTSDWKRYSVSGKISALNKAFVIYFKGNYDVYLKCVKIEKGNKPTDYTQAPEDIESQFNSVNNTLKAYKTDFDLFKDGMSLRVAEIDRVNNRINDLNIQNLVYNSEFSNNAEGWTNIGNNSAGTILFSNNEWDSWQGSNGLAFRNSSAPTSTLLSQSKRFKVLNWQRISASVQLHVTDTITNSCDAGMEIVFYPDETSGNEIKRVSQTTSRVNNISNGFAKLLYVNDVEVPSNAKFATLRLWTYKVGNVIFNQPMMTFSSSYLPYTQDNKSLGVLSEKYAALDVKVNGINSVVANKADMSYVNQKADQWQLALTNLQIGGTNIVPLTNQGTKDLYVENKFGSSTYAEKTIYGARGILIKSTTPAPSNGWFVIGKNIDLSKFKPDTDYVLSFNLRSDMTIKTQAVIDVCGSNALNSISTYDRNYSLDLQAGKVLKVEKKIHTLANFDNATRVLYINCTDLSRIKNLEVWNFKIEEGNKATPWSPAPEDDMAAITAVRNELNTAINLRVQKNELLSQINMQAGRTLIQSNKIYLDAESVVFSGKAFIPSAAIASLSADKINGGTINGRTVNVTNLNANNITSGTINGQNLSINLDNGLVQFQRGKITKADNSFTIDIDTGEISSSDTTGAKLYVNKGALSTVNRNDEGMFLENGSLILSSKRFWESYKEDSKAIKYGKVEIIDRLFEDGSGGMDINSPNGVLLRTEDFNLTSLFLRPGTVLDVHGSGLAMYKNSAVIGSSGVVSIFGGKLSYDPSNPTPNLSISDILAGHVDILVGTEFFPLGESGSGGASGRNIVIKADKSCLTTTDFTKYIAVTNDYVSVKSERTLISTDSNVSSYENNSVEFFSEYKGLGRTGSSLSMEKGKNLFLKSDNAVVIVGGKSEMVDLTLKSYPPHISIGAYDWAKDFSVPVSNSSINIVGWNINAFAFHEDINLKTQSNKNVHVMGGGMTIDNGLQVHDLHVLGWLGVDGSKNSIVDTSQGKTAINAYETAEYYFGDIAKANTGTSKRVKIMIDPLFLETINTDIDYHVFVSSYNNGYAWVSEMAKDYFVIESNVPNLSVSYELKAKRKQYENVRLDKVDVNLTGGTK